jgi:hypothetical protein
MAVMGSGASNQPLPSACLTKKPESGYPAQNATIGMEAKKMTPARQEFRGAAIEPAKKPSPNSPTPAKPIERRNQPGSRSPEGIHTIPNFASMKSPRKTPRIATDQLNTIFPLYLMID